MRFWRLRYCIGAACSALLVLAASPARASTLIDRDPLSAHVQALGDVLTWQHGYWAGRPVTLRRRIGGRTSSAPRVPRQVTEFGDLGRSASGAVVQMLSACPAAVSLASCRFWAYDVHAGRARRIRLPPVGRGCYVRDVALWRRRMALAVLCGTSRGETIRLRDGRILLRRGTRVRRLRRLDGFDDYWTTVELDVSAHAVAAWVRRSGGGEEPDVYRSWLMRDGCTAELIAAVGEFNAQIDSPQLDGGRVYWLEGTTAPHTARLMAGRVGPRCAHVSPRTVMTLPSWREHIEGSILGRRLFITRDRSGVRRLRLP